jgi:stage V sporulation protein G
MEVTDVRIRKLHPPGMGDGGSKMRAIVSVTFDNEFVVHDIKVIQGEEKHFIAMPSRKMEDGAYKDITHPIKSALRDKIQNAVLTRYEQALAEMEASERARSITPPENNMPSGSDEFGGGETK